MKEERRFIPKHTPCKMVYRPLIPAFRRLKKENRDFKVMANLRPSAGLKNKTKQTTAKNQNRTINSSKATSYLTSV